jgi:hypothetical protein
MILRSIFTGGVEVGGIFVKVGKEVFVDGGVVLVGVKVSTGISLGVDVGPGAIVEIGVPADPHADKTILITTKAEKIFIDWPYLFICMIVFSSRESVQFVWFHDLAR